jgi:hypothetical protein
MEDRRVTEIRRQYCHASPCHKETFNHVAFARGNNWYFSEIGAKDYEQASSSLFIKLPLEVRGLIWEHAISGVGQGPALHIFPRGPENVSLAMQEAS